MNKTVFCHFFNEEYLLPWWLNHHKQIFDHGVMVNYASTDRSVDIIKDSCPSWDIVDSRNEKFSALAVDNEIMDLEKNYVGFKLCLNVTEFFIYNGEEIKEGMWEVHRATIVDNDPENIPSYQSPLVSQKHFGFLGANGINGEVRYAHTLDHGHYGGGRHNVLVPVSGKMDSIIFWYGFAPFTKELMKRKTQIRDRIPNEEQAAGIGFQHLWSEDQINSHRIAMLNRSHNIEM